MSTADVHDDAVDLVEPDFLYELKRPIGIWPAVYIVGAVALLGVAGVLFLIGLLLPPEAQAFPVFIGTIVGRLVLVVGLGLGVLGLILADVIVNGKIVLERGRHTGARPGAILYGQGRK